MTGAAAVAFGWVALVPLSISSKPSAQTSDSTKSVAVSPMTVINVQELERLARIDLRRPLHDATPPARLIAQAAMPLSIRLTGTICEPGHCRAMIELADGTVQLKAIGEQAGEARILDIREGSVTVEYLGKPQILTVAKGEQN